MPSRIHSYASFAFAFVAACGLVCAHRDATAQERPTLQAAALAATCAACHGTNGHAAPGSALPALAGTPKSVLLAQLQAFKSGSRPATIMGQLSKGYSDAQLDQIAAYFAAQPRANP
jgi:sulfide dehydrogenase cytochrome subunit